MKLVLGTRKNSFVEQLNDKSNDQTKQVEHDFGCELLATYLTWPFLRVPRDREFIGPLIWLVSEFGQRGLFFKRTFTFSFRSACCMAVENLRFPEKKKRKHLLHA